MADESLAHTAPRLTRRECLQRGAGAILAAGVAAVGGSLLHDSRGDAGLEPPEAVPPPPDFFANVVLPAAAPRISVATGDAEGIDRMVRAAVAGLDPVAGMRRFICAGDRVLIKPNVGFDRPPHLGATTHPEVLRALIRLCREAGAQRVVVTDNPIESPAVCFARSGIQQVCDEEGAAVVLPTPASFPVVDFGAAWPDGRPDAALGHWPVLYEPLTGATKLIGVAPVKDHNLAGASMVLKNWYGLLGGRRNELHQRIHETISDLAALFVPTLVVADGTRVMVRNGPTGGRSSDVQPGGLLGRAVVVAAVDPVACDGWCYENLLGRDAGRLAYLHMAAEKLAARAAVGVRGVGVADWREYERAGQVVSCDAGGG